MARAGPGKLLGWPQQAKDVQGPKNERLDTCEPDGAMNLSRRHRRCLRREEQKVFSAKLQPAHKSSRIIRPLGPEVRFPFQFPRNQHFSQPVIR